MLNYTPCAVPSQSNYERLWFGWIVLVSRSGVFSCNPVNIMNHVNMFNSFPILNLFCFAQICENTTRKTMKNTISSTFNRWAVHRGVVLRLSSFRSSRIYHFCLTRNTPIFTCFWQIVLKIHIIPKPEWSGYFWGNNMEYPYSTHHFRGDQPVTRGRYFFCPNNLSLTFGTERCWNPSNWRISNDS